MRTIRTSVVGTLALALLVGAPLGAAAGEAVAPSEVTGTVTCTSYWLPGDLTDEVVGPLEEGNLVRRESRGYLGRLAADDISDERLAGEYTQYMDHDEYFTAETEPPEHLIISSGALLITNDGGRWLGEDQAFYLPGTFDPELEPRWEQLALHGSGDYAGLTALVEMRLTNPDCYCWGDSYGQPGWCQWELRGVVLEGEMPPLPTVPE